MLQPLDTAARLLASAQEADRDRVLVLVTDGQPGTPGPAFWKRPR